MRNYSRNTWTKEADEAIVNLVNELGVKRWTKIARSLEENYGIKGRTGKQCRERWFNHLDPNINSEKWTLEEEKVLFECQKKYGNCWTKMTEFLPGRTDNAIKNYFYSTLRRNLRRYNKKKPKSQQIHGKVQELIKVPELANLLTRHSERKKTPSEKLSSIKVEIPKPIPMSSKEKKNKQSKIEEESQLLLSLHQTKDPEGIWMKREGNNSDIEAPQAINDRAAVQPRSFPNPNSLPCMNIGFISFVTNLRNWCDLCLNSQNEMADNKGCGVHIKSEDIKKPDCFLDSPI
ncbi:unnamed protein product [Blepharisma stoltei]|uniref:Uncharacterized protein n=1 Tax=Blepharisma stoltei TaxID=1481888 RepID=A0AAU9JK72_9CILI|nr:unnamed protein product [Blepharisma stoltei]